MIVSDPSTLLGGQQPNGGASMHRKLRRVIMNLLLFVLEIFVIVAAIALVPARSELRPSRARVTHNEREHTNSLRS
jgi:Tfp pilus assembly protein PilX